MTDLPQGRLTQEQWEEHITKAKAFAGSEAEYCKSNGLSKSQFNYRKLKLRAKKKSAFAGVHVRSTKTSRVSPRLPDPKWLSEFIHNLMEFER